MKERIVRAKAIKLFKSKDHKSNMLFYLFVAMIIIHLLSLGIDMLRGRDVMIIIKSAAIAVFLASLYLYMRYAHKVQMFATILMLSVEVELTLIVLQDNYLHFSTVYPMLLTFGLFFFFDLKKALWFTLFHHMYWFCVFAYGYTHYIDHPVLHNVTSIVGMMIAYAFMVLFGFFYYISTEVAYEKLERSDRQKAILLNEIHHRIKNNLNMMASVLGLQILNIKSNETKDVNDALLNSKLRIQAMAMVHESLYRHKEFDTISFYDYVTNLTDLINRSYDKNVGVFIDGGEIQLPLESMMQLGIILNELFTNSIKYAFDDDKKSEISIKLQERGEEYIFVYHENHNKNVDIAQILKSKTLGMKLLKLIVAQINGKLQVEKNEGLRFTITFPK